MRKYSPKWCSLYFNFFGCFALGVSLFSNNSCVKNKFQYAVLWCFIESLICTHTPHNDIFGLILTFLFCVFIIPLVSFIFCLLSICGLINFLYSRHQALSFPLLVWKIKMVILFVDSPPTLKKCTVYYK